MYARHAGFLPDVAAFDAAAFRRAPPIWVTSAAAEHSTCSPGFRRDSLMNKLVGISVPQARVMLLLGAVPAVVASVVLSI